MSTVADTPAGPPATTAQPDALAVEHIDVSYRVRGRQIPVVRDVSFRIGRGESYGLVGESGCGKSTIALAVVRYLARNGNVSSGGISIDGRDVLALKSGDLRELRQTTVSMVYQEPGRALNPTLKVGRQVAEVYELAGLKREQALERSREMLEKVRISDPGGVMNRYPHQLSGGMLQRVVIAMALAAEPALLILDEPTTALDATVESEVLDLISALRDEFGTSLMFISHNLGVIAKMCDRVGVLYAGEMIEEGPARQVFNDPRHPYTVGLLRCIPRRDMLKARRNARHDPGLSADAGIGPEGVHLRRPLRARRGSLSRGGATAVRRRTGTHVAVPLPRARADASSRVQGRAPADWVTQCDAPTLISATDVSKTFHMAGQKIHGLVDVSLEVRKGETLGLVGESGSGKTTFARVLLGLTAPDDGATLDVRGRTAGRHVTETLPGTEEGAPDRVPEPRLGAQPPPLGQAPAVARPVEARRLQRRRDAGAAQEADLRRAAVRAPPGDEAGPALGRSQAARRDRARVRRRSADRRLRRAHLGA